MPRKKRTSAESHVTSPEGISATTPKEELVTLLRSGYFRSPAELAQYMAQGKLGRPENVSKIYVRATAPASEYKNKTLKKLGRLGSPAD